MKYNLKRILAFLIDSVIFIVLFSLSSYLMDFINNQIKSDFFEINRFLFFLGMSILLAFLIQYFIEIILRASIGKKIFQLQIFDLNRGKPDILIIFIRNLIKTILLITVAGAFFSLISYLDYKIAWYDNLLGLNVDETKRNNKDFYNNFKR